MDPEVLAKVIDRTVEDDELIPAMLHGFRRAGSPDVVYPRLIDDHRARTAGVVLEAPSDRDLVRLHWFEEGEYRAAETMVVLANGRSVQVHHFSALDAVLPALATDWCPVNWALRHKAEYLACCTRWMQDCPSLDLTHRFVRGVLATAAGPSA